MIAHSIGRFVKVGLSYALFHLGILQLWQKVALRGKVVVLMYHRVLSVEDRRRTGSHPGIIVTCDTFAMHMAVLKRRFVVLTLDEFARYLADRRPFPDSSCVITFDDGWRDNFTNALPVLKQHGLPAVIFLPVNYIGAKRLFWREALTHLLVQAVHDARRDACRRGRLESLLAQAALDSVLSVEDEDPRGAIVEVVSAAHGLKWDRANELLNDLSCELQVRSEELVTLDDFMDWAEVESMGADGVVFGGHGAEHRILTELSADAVDDEVRACAARLTACGVGGLRAFSYPNGAWTPAIAESVKQGGYSVAFTTKPGFVRLGDDAFSVRRINIHEDAASSEPLFLTRILNIF